MEKIDFVIPWVDGNDKDWILEKEMYSCNKETGNIRYRDYGTLKYLLRSIDIYAPWVNKIYLVTWGHVPEWLDLDNKKLKIIKHKDFIPLEYLPTFSSNVIELNVHRIPNLSNNFVLFNDDMIINNPVTKDDFFIQNKPKDFGIYSIIPADNSFSHMLLNNVIVINKHFNKKNDLKAHWKKYIQLKYGKQLVRSFLSIWWSKIPGYYNPHLPVSYNKSSFETVWKLESGWLDRTSSNRFRESDDLTDWVVRYWQIESGNFEPQRITFGKYLTVRDATIVKNELNSSKYKILCINDTEEFEEFEKSINIISDTLNKKFPDKSKFEC